MIKFESEPLECDECGEFSLVATYYPVVHNVTYYCNRCKLEFYDTNLDFDREDVIS